MATTTTWQRDEQKQYNQQDQENHYQYQLLEDALSFESNILHLVLKRNENQHSRAHYYRRMTMALRAIQRSQIISYKEKNDKDNNRATKGMDRNGLAALINSIQSEHNRFKSIVHWHGNNTRTTKKQKRQRKQCDEKWKIAENGNVVVVNVNGCEDDTNKTIPLSSILLIRNIEQLYDIIARRLPEIQSRILYAASALYTELSRGYFLPFCTVSLACISRMRVLLMRMGRDGVVQMQKTLGWLKDDVLVNMRVKDDSEGGMLNELTGLSIDQVKGILKRCTLDERVMDNFIELDDNDYNTFVETRAKHVVLNRAYENLSMSSLASRQWIESGNVKKVSENSLSLEKKEKSTTRDDERNVHDPDLNTALKLESNTLANIPSNLHKVSDIVEEVGECVDITILSDASKKDNPGVTANYFKQNLEGDLDRNLELVSLLKPQTKQNMTNIVSINKREKEKDENSMICSKRKNLHTDNARNGLKTKKEVDLGGASCVNMCSTEKPKKRKKSVKKEKKRSKQKKGDIFDEIFGGLC